MAKRIVAAEQSVWDAVKAAGQHYQQRQALGKGNAFAKKHLPTDIIKVRNVSGDNRRGGEVMELGDLIIDEEELTNEYLWLEGIEPTGDNDRIGILRKPLPDGEIGELQVSGVCKSWVNVTDAAHTHAKAVSTSHALESSESGPLVILHKPSGTGELDCVVVFRGDSGGADPPDPCVREFIVPIAFELNEETCEIEAVQWLTITFDEHGCITETITPEEE